MLPSKAGINWYVSIENWCVNIEHWHKQVCVNRKLACRHRTLIFHDRKLVFHQYKVVCYHSKLVFTVIENRFIALLILYATIAPWVCHHSKLIHLLRKLNTDFANWYCNTTIGNWCSTVVNISNKLQFSSNCGKSCNCIHERICSSF